MTVFHAALKLMLVASTYVTLYNVEVDVGIHKAF